MRHRSSRDAISSTFDTSSGPPIVKVYGERNTGTNYLSELLSQNLRVQLVPGVASRRIGAIAEKADSAARVLHVSGLRPSERIKDLWFSTTFRSNLGWKHMLVSVDLLAKADLAGLATFVTLSKNPYSWAISMFKRPYHSIGEPPATLPNFLQAPWPTVGREHGPKHYSSPIELWNDKNSAYLALPRQFRSISVSYEDLLRDPFGVVEAVRVGAEADVVTAPYSNVLASTKGDRDKGYEFYRRYYLEEEWRRDLSAESVSVINASLDQGLVESLGYEILDPNDFAPEPS